MNTAHTVAYVSHCAYLLRYYSVLMTTAAQSGHVSSCLSAADIMAALFFYAMRFDPRNPGAVSSDHFILSKGHAAPLLYAVYAIHGCIKPDLLLTYRSHESIFEGHPTPRFIGAHAATGSLGQGLSIALGMAYAQKTDQQFFTYCLLGDGEMAEGQIWEAFQLAAFYNIDHLIAILDCNRLGQTGPTMYAHDYHLYQAKAESFGWRSIIVDGHNVTELMDLFEHIRNGLDGRPTLIIARTYKGYGLQIMQNKEGWHGVALKPEQEKAALHELQERFAAVAFYDGPVVANNIIHCPSTQIKKIESVTIAPVEQNIPVRATRYAYGQALTAYAHRYSTIMSLDADVNNSTGAHRFAQTFPERFVNCFIAEQNMVSMAVGLERMGYMPFVSTFGAFFSRAYDQIRMAAISRCALRLVGSHAGIAIGQDGPSQMALEDIALMSAVPNSIILYPADEQSTYACVARMIEYDAGISYLRTTRQETPQIYTDHEFRIGGCHLLRQSAHDSLVIVAAGITLHNALHAYELLRDDGIYCCVIDAYSIKPLAVDAIIAAAKVAHNTIITVEDHYLSGGLGYALAYAVRNENIHIAALAVPSIPMSAPADAQMAWAGIDARSIVSTVKKIIEQRFWA